MRSACSRVKSVTRGNNVLLYVKGGAAVTADKYRINTAAGNVLLASANDDTRWGGVVGVGLEYGFAPNWSVGVEYNHLFMQDRTTTFTTPGGAFFSNERIRQDVDLVTARLNYKFGGPIIAEVLISLLASETAWKPRALPGAFLCCAFDITEVFVNAGAPVHLPRL